MRQHESCQQFGIAHFAGGLVRVFGAPLLEDPLNNMRSFLLRIGLVRNRTLRMQVVPPQEEREFTLEELRPFDGTSETPEGHAAPPIYVGVKGKVRPSGWDRRSHVFL